MSNSSALTLPALLVCASLTLVPLSSWQEDGSYSFNFPVTATYQTNIPTMFSQSFECSYERVNLRNEALQLFGIQSEYTLEEQASYRAMLNNNSTDLGINILDYM